MLQKLQHLLRGVGIPGTSKPAGRASNAGAQDVLFDLFEKGLVRGVNFATLTEIDRFVDNRAAGLFLKHDVHDVDLNGLVAFAEREAGRGIRGTYFFMTPDHPRTQQTYGFADQIRAMKAIQGLGHELGLHIDPYYQIDQERLPLGGVLHRLSRIFEGHGIRPRIGNMHGNSAYKCPDKDGFGTSFDLFEELARQSDFPDLAGVSAETAKLIQRNRVRLTDHGYAHWGDMPLWSARHGIVATNFLTDNRFGEQGVLELLMRPETTSAYYISAQAVPGSRNLADGGRRIVTGRGDGKMTGSRLSAHFAPDAPELGVLLSEATPLLVLIHPEFYC